MASVIAICNSALGRVGGAKITSLDDPSVEAARCKEVYPLARQFVLAAREWSFAVRRRVLSPIVSSSSFGYTKSFKKPSKSLRILTVYDGSSSAGMDDVNDLDWSLEGDEIRCDADTIKIRYIEDIEESALFSPGFVEALSVYMASQLAISLAQSASLSGNYLGLFEQLVSQAAAVDGMQGRSRKIRSGRLVSVRR